MENKGKVKFIRKNGRVIPVKDNGKGSNNSKKPKQKKYSKESGLSNKNNLKTRSGRNKEMMTQVAVSKMASNKIDKSQKRSTKFAVVGGMAGLALGSKFKRLGKLGGAMAGFIGGAIGSGEGSKQRKLKYVRDRADTNARALSNLNQGSSV